MAKKDQESEDKNLLEKNRRLSQEVQKAEWPQLDGMAVPAVKRE
jgi:hypothetical protein